MIGRCGSASSFTGLLARCYTRCMSSAAAEPGILSYEEAVCDSETRDNEAIGVLVHGLLGSGRNWRDFSKALANDLARESNRPWRFVLVDQRCHGRSHGLPGFSAPSDVPASAADIRRFLDHRLGARKAEVLLGHSLGGKVVMELLTSTKDHPPAKQAWVLDSVIGAAQSGESEPSDVKRVLEVVERIPLPIESRDWLYKYLEDRGFSAGFRLWMGSNLAYVKDGYRWTFDIKCAQQLYESYQKCQFWDLMNEPPPGLKLNIVRAANSDRWTKKHWADLQACSSKSQGGIKLHILPNAGHWLHADNPQGLRELLTSHIASSSSA